MYSLKRAIRRARRAHLRDIRAWHRETGKKDWVMLKSLPIGGGFQEYLYIWRGPEGTDGQRICGTTKQSVTMLHGLRKALAEFRFELAKYVSEKDSAEPEYVDWTI